MLKGLCHGNHDMNILDAITHTCNYHVLLLPPNHSQKGSAPEKNRCGVVETQKNSCPAWQSEKASRRRSQNLKDGWDLTSGACEMGVPGGARAQRWESMRKVLALESIL